MKIIIYSSIMGGFDSLREQPRFPDTEYICFTDNPQLRSPGWKLIQVQSNPEELSRVTAKRFKTCPHRFLPPDYDYSIWIDGSVRIENPKFVEVCLAALKKWGIACMKHPRGHCIYQEAKGCARMEKFFSQRTIEQAHHYRTLGYPENQGLAACGIIVRDAKNKKVMRIGEQWLEENLLWTFSDQVSFPFVLWRNQHWFDLLPIDYHDTSFFSLAGHQQV